MAKVKSGMSVESTARQRKYVADLEAKGDALGLVFADAFVRGMRDIGYKNNAWALCELIDNAIQAAATTVAVQFGFAPNKKSEAKPDMIAVVDNGVGMIPKMISYAVRWGGTDREDDRTGFGRYGYGLPSASVSICKRFTVYSRVKGGDWHAVTVDIDELSKVASDVDATNKLLEARKADPPEWIAIQNTEFEVAAIESGTMVVLEKLDRLQWKTTGTLQSKLMQHMGVIYRHWLPSPRLLVNGEVVQPVDPLFLMENALYYDETEVMARRIETRAIDVETSPGVRGHVKVRAALLPPNFQNADPKRFGHGSPLAKRHKIMRDYNGIQVCRSGRQIDCIQPRWTKFQTLDYNVKIEVDFDPELDEFFGITTAKQQIVIDDDMWNKIEQAGGLIELVKDARRALKEQRADLQGKQDSERHSDEPRPSEKAMMETEKFKPRPDKPSDKKRAEARKNLENAAAKISETTGKPKQEIIKELEDRAARRRFEVECHAMPEGPFYRPRRLGEQKRLIINTQHPFYSKVYSVSPEIKFALEVLLFVLAEAELESEGDAEVFYQAARGHWSERLRHALDRLHPDDEMRDKAAAVAEEMHVGTAAE